MFIRKTVLVIGAGCSREYGLPVGDGLRDKIVNLLRTTTNFLRDSGPFDPQFIGAIQQAGGGKAGEWLQAAEEMSRGLSHASSIDRFLDFHRGDPKFSEIGKIAIARVILAEEANSTLKLSNGLLNLEEIAVRGEHPVGLAPKPYKNWMQELFSRIQNVDKNSLGDMFNNISIICFNYDRCIEHYFYNSLREFSRCSDAEARSALDKLSVVHPYGQVGFLDWQASPQQEVVPFGGDINHPGRLVKISQSLKTFTETLEENDQIIGMRRAIQDAQQIAFLGFSFLEQNMELMRPASHSQATRVYATTYGEPYQNQELYSSSIRRLLSGDSQHVWDSDPILESGQTAGAFMHAYGNTLRL